MKTQNSCSDAFAERISAAIDSLKNDDRNAAQKIISEALVLNPDAPELHNLLGILSEIKGNDNIARKHYRAAYALDPTYKPACRNLERITVFKWGLQSRDFDFGDTQT
ncbi:hypothetical protein [Mahella australiensis]|uniref:Uncharacterized protein n=1 Tax=Mahella australiensis (strain DSM 15567 / CIP 107919 / 50-1 BON) TaxID=697281 RepID=F4A0C7_MAHA5|nr:hypothetical protein [Mahella australiensis]AEE97988.1 hypothetical protein Mahau_2864 [Mahella australiensis 50-1 BON]